MDSWKAQIKPCAHQDPGERRSDPTETDPYLPVSVQEVARKVQSREEGLEVSSRGAGIQRLGLGRQPRYRAGTWGVGFWGSPRMMKKRGPGLQ